MDEENLFTMLAIVSRAEEKQLLHFGRLSLMMDLEVANRTFHLRLQELLEADDFNFAHDIVGIQNNIDRQSKTFRDLFIPRYSAPCADQANESEEEQTCRNCGCTWDNACPGGCHWVEENLCSCCTKSDWD